MGRNENKLNTMKKKLTLWQRFWSHTPALITAIQNILTGLSAACGAVWIAWGKVPLEFRESIPSEVLSGVAIVGLASIFLLQFTTKKTEKSK